MPRRAPRPTVAQDPLSSSLEVEVVAHGYDPEKSLATHDLKRRTPAEAGVRELDPSIDDVAVIREKHAQRAVDREEMSNPLEKVGPVG